MNNWKQIWELWQSYEVPKIQIKEFIIGKNTIYSPWLRLDEERQVYFENPIKDTANHLSVYLKDKDEELVAAYKIYAFLKYHDYKYLLQDSLLKGMNKFNEDLYGWWHPSAKNILPYCKEYLNVPYDFKESNWKEIVYMAAENWKQITKEWAIILIPDFMDRDSKKYQDFEEYSRNIHEDREYHEYLRLKEKYEK